MKKYIFAAVGLFLVCSMAIAGIKTVTSHQNLRSATVSGAYATSLTDTVKFSNMDAGLSALSFAAHYKDSVSVTRATIRRVIDGTVTALIAGDTLTAFTSFATTGSGNPNSSVSAPITLSPLADEYWVVIIYAGGTVNGTNANTVRYEFLKTLNK